ncbi:hypothetical protein PoB_000378200 [Plakobranchus ocellatus]|uniref:Uncharacterized protein n=1 Tax=Plakobranchus ocellatus TaxID=259542 RepID=A0AAV3Y497_9GAST|nr:hypothetical protein PoB_000378200 [Plakobranchus ocellatus]
MLGPSFGEPGVGSLIVLDIRHPYLVCHCSPRRLYFRWILRGLAAHLVRGKHWEDMKSCLGRDWELNLGLLTSGQLPTAYQISRRSSQIL